MTPAPWRPCQAKGGNRTEGAWGVPAARGAWVLAALGSLLVLAGLLAGAGGLALSGEALGPSLRLRVVAASNAPADQRVKLAVRDAVLQDIAPALAGATTAADAAALVRKRLPSVEQVARAVAGRFGQHVTVRLGPTPFPTERIGWLVFPAGRYPALAIYLGAARGHNWWTVLFPPLAFVTIGGRLAVVGPRQPLTAAQQDELLGRMRGRRVAVHGPGGLAGTRVQVRFALWDLMRSLVQRSPRWLLAWLGPTSATARA